MDYVYYPWTTANGRGRLQQAVAEALQDLRYTYDAVGNVLTIQDYKAGSPQTQAFAYDSQGRLTSAQASGGTGGTYGPEAYAYNAIGNMTSKARMSYSYDAGKPHAVRRVAGSGESSKTVTVRAKGTCFYEWRRP